MPTEVKNILDLIKYHCGGYNFINLVVELNINSSKRTIEFRQHESTIDGEKVTQWIHLCVGLVNLSAAAETNELAPRLRKLINVRRKSISVADVLEDLGLERSAKYYREQVSATNHGTKVGRLWSATKKWTSQRTVRRTAKKLSVKRDIQGHRQTVSILSYLYPKDPRVSPEEGRENKKKLVERFFPLPGGGGC